MSSRAATRVFQGVEEQIATGQLKDGAKLDEASLAERFEVSRTPVREALLQLVGSGLATQIPKRGCFVKAPSLRDMVEMFEVMSELEGMCARLAARRISDEQLAELKAANVGCEDAIKANDSDLYYHKNVDFHECIYTHVGIAFLPMRRAPYDDDCSHFDDFNFVFAAGCLSRWASISRSLRRLKQAMLTKQIESRDST